MISGGGGVLLLFIPPNQQIAQFCRGANDQDEEEEMGRKVGVERMMRGGRGGRG